MSNVIDELKVVFSAETGSLVSGLSQISGQLVALQGVSGAAQASLRNLAAAFAGGMSGVTGEAYSAGANAGAAFAKGLRAQAGSVRSAAKYLSAAALNSLGRGNVGAGAGASGFGTSVLNGETGSAAGKAVKTTEIVVPLNVDGVKMGEACIRAVNQVSGMTGKAHIVI
ncbi:MAG: hypothetical protein IJC56_11155 [Clostridia bacterium]|nr:hypothetical protein [Clostridia bacterium]